MKFSRIAPLHYPNTSNVFLFPQKLYSCKVAPYVRCSQIFPLFLSVSSLSTTNLFFFLLGSGTEGDSSRLNHVCLEHTPCLLSHSNTSRGVFWRWIVRPFSSSSTCPPASPLAASSCFPFALLIYSQWKASRFHCVCRLLVFFFGKVFPRSPKRPKKTGLR